MKIMWTETAVLDLEQINDFISKDSPYYASVFIDRVLNVIEQIKQFPQKGRVVPEVQDKSIREVLYNGYRIIYKVHHDNLLILAIVHGARNLHRINHWYK